MGSGNRGGFVVDKGDATDCDFGLGLKMMMMGNHHHHDHHTHDEESGSKFARLSDDQGSSSPGGSSGVSGGGIGNLGAMSSGVSTTTYPSSSTGYGHVVRSSIASAVQRSSASFDPSSIKSQQGGSLMGLGGGGETARVFTASQRQELERQTIIYKYMAASIPVPPELLIPITFKYQSRLYQSNDHGSNGGKSGLDLRYTIGSKDAEPWRCRRTDGKKWRCSRDVAPDQKYCERHSHKGRPSRSRKLVETSSSPSSTSVNPANMNLKPSFLHHSSPSMFLPQNPSQSGQSRFPEWFMKREAHNDEETSASLFFPQTELDQMNPTRTSNLFMGNDQNQSATLPRQFLDAWAMGSKSDGMVLTGKAVDSGSSSSLLTLSMSGGGTEDSSEEARLGMGLFEPDKGGGGSGGERYSWMGSSAPGGPLAEALCLGIVGATDAGGSRDPGESGGGQEGFSK